MKISVCVPMYNENRVIAESAKTLSQYMSANFEDYEIVFCSDGSTDGCDKTVEALNLPNVRVIGYEKNQGKGCAVRTAILAATGDVRMFTDADLAYGTGVIKQVADAFEANPDADMVIGSRNLDKSGYEGYTFLRKIMSKVYIKVLCIAGGFKLSDSQCGCKAFRADAAEKIFSRCEVNGFAFDFEAILWAVKMKMKIKEIPVRVINHGESKVRIIRDTLKMLKDLVKMKRRIRKTPV
ncbi:MAG: glycosyltransferase [Ruminococcaceae bacterium]|nr:glycosyltransferase [Oscillospiraceae bacterium]